MMLDKNSVVLVVDDMKTMRRLISIQLKKLGFTNIIEAETVKEAVTAIKEGLKDQEPIGLIISDWNMPDISGMEFLQMLKKNDLTQDIPFIMVSANQDEEKIGIILNQGAAAYLKKPLTIDQLEGAIISAFSDE